MEGYIFLGIIILLIASLITATVKRSKFRASKPVFIQSFALGTVIQISSYGNNGREAMEEAVMEIGDIDDRMSFYKEDSDISKINQNAGGEFQKVSDQTYFVLKRAVDYSILSKGAIDLTVRPITNLWGIGSENPQIPDKEVIDETLKLVNYKDIEFDSMQKAVRLKKTGQSIDVNCIAKGFAADEAKRILLKHKIKHAVINLGGNVVVIGSKLEGTPWRIGIQHPAKDRGNYIGFIDVIDKSIVTSGDYEKFFMYNNEKYHHIIDSRTGYPVKNKIISTTVISEYSIDGDALTTCLYVLGVNEGLKFIECIKDVDAIVITEDKAVYTTERLKKSFIITDREFSEVI